MKLLLLRHAQAVVGGDLDPDRVLTPVGERQAAAMASRVFSMLSGACIVTSPWRRAQQTAEIIAQELGTRLVLNDSLTAIGTAPAAAAALESYFSEQGSLIVVTHQPLCGQLISWLTDGNLYGQVVSPCSGALLELDWPARGMARLLNGCDGAVQGDDHAGR